MAVSRRGRSTRDVDAVRDFFTRYVFGLMESDLKREVWLATKYEHDRVAGVYPGPHPGGSNLVAALALLCYTETLGVYMTDAGSEQSFRKFLHSMGDCYRAFDRSQRNPSVYTRFRNGLAHRYEVEGGCFFAMRRGGGERCGIGFDDKQQSFYFVVERYFDDFRLAARRLFHDLTGDNPPPL